MAVGGLSTKNFILFCVIVLAFQGRSVIGRGVNGGPWCAGCTFAITLVDQVSQIYNETIDVALDRMCRYLPGIYQEACHVLVGHFGPVVIKLLSSHATPDVVCNAIAFCYKDKGEPMCHLFPQPKGGLEKEIIRSKNFVWKYLRKRNLHSFPDICTFPGVKIVCKIIERVTGSYAAGIDLDNDGFSIVKTLRGTLWRGRDCNDFSREIYPGRKPHLWDVYRDTNCNGIYGEDKVTGRPYEDLYCDTSGPRGVAVLGDSVSAHFHIPFEWANATLLSQKVLEYVPFVIENEFDWPMLSSTTGFQDNSWPIIHGPVDSIYLRLRKRNRCNHRDYQNIGVNGADSLDMLKIQQSLSRNQTTDHPMLVFYALVGNDVCNWHVKDTVQHMTTPKQMKHNIENTLSFLDGALPSGSHVLIIGLADGRVLYNNLHKRIHPLGSLHRDLTYTDLYNYLNCLQTSPCAGWMNKNETIRNQTSERAIQLSKVLQQVAKTHKYKNFDVGFISNPLHAVLDNWGLKYGFDRVYELIDPVDGFHPNQRAQAEIAEYIWTYLDIHLPDYIGDINPFNVDIQRRYGDQGGY